MERLPDRIESARLLLRRYTDADVDALSVAVAESADHLRPWMPWIAAEPLSGEARREFVRGWERDWSDGGDVVYGVFLGDVIIGGTGLHHRVGPTGLEIGYWVHVDHVRRGYASELTAALTAGAFGVEGVEQVEIHHDKANVASAGVPARLGYTLVAEVPDPVDAPGEMGIECRWVLRRDEWLARGSSDI